MNYSCLLFDADETLLDFKKAEARAICETFRRHDLAFNETILHTYSEINQRYWKEFEQGRLDKPTLLIERFRRLFQVLSLNADPHQVRLTYQEELGLGAYWKPGAKELLQMLRDSGCYQIYIVTNGVSVTQHSRFALCGLDQLSDDVFVSEDIGYQKPKPEYFSCVFERIPGFRKERTLLIGDSLTADIAGGIAAGIDTCWYNPGHQPCPQDCLPTYEIDEISLLQTIL